MVGAGFGKGIFRCLKLCRGSKVGGRMMSTSSSPPWLMLPMEGGVGGGGDMFFSLSENKMLSLKKRHCLIDNGNDLEIKGSSNGWLCVYNRRDRGMFLTNPISGRHIELPADNGCVRKVIISGSPDAEGDECRAVMISGGQARLSFCCPGRSREWTPLIGDMFSGKDRHYEDVVYSSRHKRIIGLRGDYSNELEVWDVTNPGSPSLDCSDEPGLLSAYYVPLYTFPSRFHQLVEELDLADTRLNTWSLRYLVSAHDQLYLVTRHLVQQVPLLEKTDKDKDEDYPCKTLAFGVHKIDREQGKLVFMEEGSSLDGLAMFVGLNDSFAVSAAEFPGLRPNSIYFTHDRRAAPAWMDGSYGGHDIGIFDYENKAIYPCYSFKRIKPAPIWFTPTHP